MVATEFIKQNGYKAQEKRGDDSFISCGVSLQSVRQHILENIPGLADYGICKTTVQYFFNAVDKGRIVQGTNQFPCAEKRQQPLA